MERVVTFRRVAPYTGVRPVVVLVGNIHTLKRIGWLPSVPPRVRAPELGEQLAEAGIPWVSVLQHWPGECAGPGPAGPDRERGGTCRGWDDLRTDGGLCTARSARGSRCRRVVGLSVASSRPSPATVFRCRYSLRGLDAVCCSSRFYPSRRAASATACQTRTRSHSNRGPCNPAGRCTGSRCRELTSC